MARNQDQSEDVSSEVPAATTLAANSKGTGFLDLPAEIRECIYRLVLEPCLDNGIRLLVFPPKDRPVIGYHGAEAKALCRMARSCRHTHEEVSPLLYGMPSFILGSFASLHRFLHGIGRNVAHLQTIVVDHRHYKFAPAYADFQYLETSFMRLRAATQLRRVHFGMWRGACGDEVIRRGIARTCIPFLRHREGIITSNDNLGREEVLALVRFREPEDYLTFEDEGRQDRTVAQDMQFADELRVLLGWPE